MGIQRGRLVIADIGGYTRHLKAVELDHAHDILADLIGVVAEVMDGALEVAKLEGDAVFAFEPTDERDAERVLTVVERPYFAFARRLRDIDRLTTCSCNACHSIPGLDLKFVVHHGEFVADDHEMESGSGDRLAALLAESQPRPPTPKRAAPRSRRGS